MPRSSLAVLVVLGALAGGCGDTDTAKAPLEPIETAAKTPNSTNQLTQLLRQNMAVFRRPAVPADRVTPALREALADSVPNSNIAEARAVKDPMGNKLWLVPAGNDVVCAYSARGSGSCGPATALINGERVGASACAGSPEKPALVVYGFVPDGVETVRVVTRDQTSSEVEVGENYWLAEYEVAQLDDLPADVRWQRADEPEVVMELPVGDDFVTEPC